MELTPAELVRRVHASSSALLDGPATSPRHAGARGQDPRQVPLTAGDRLGTALYRKLPWIVLGLLAAWLLMLGANEILPDTWFGLAGGRELLQHGFTTDNSWTRFGSREWVDQQWAAHLLSYGIWQLAGAAGLVAFNIVLICLGLGLCIRAAMLRGASPAWMACVLAVVIATASFDLWFVRAQSFSVLCFGLLALILVRDDGRLGRGVFLAIPLIAVWTNLHAAMLVGAGICAVYAVGCLLEPARQVRTLYRRALALALGALLACLATPMVVGLPWYLRHTVHNADFAKRLDEWVPTTLANSPIFVIGAFAAIAITVRAPIARRERMLVWLLTLAGFTARRSELWASLEWLVVLPVALERLRPVVVGLRLRQASLGLAALTFIALFAATAQNVRNGADQLAVGWPRAATRVVASELRREPDLKVFADQPLADWVLYSVPSSRGRLAIDGRYEVFDHATFEDVFALAEKPPRIVPRVADEDLYVLSPKPDEDGPLVRVLERDPGIVVLYRSESAVVLRRR